MEGRESTDSDSPNNMKSDEYPENEVMMKMESEENPETEKLDTLDKNKKREKPSEESEGPSMEMTLSPVFSSSSPHFSHKRSRGRPKGSGNRQLLASLGEMIANTAGGKFLPHVVTINSGEDVATKITSFSKKGPRAVCILSANGAVSNVTIRQPGSDGGILTYEGSFEILSLTGSFTITSSGGVRSRTGGLSVSLAGPDGCVVGGAVAGLLLASSKIQVIVGSFMPNAAHKLQKKKPDMDFSNNHSEDVFRAGSPVAQAKPDAETTPMPTLPEQPQGEQPEGTAFSNPSGEAEKAVMNQNGISNSSFRVLPPEHIHSSGVNGFVPGD